MHSRDTAREALDVQRAVQRRLGPARRVELAFEMSEQARALSIRGAMAREPGLAPEEARAPAAPAPGRYALPSRVADTC